MWEAKSKSVTSLHDKPSLWQACMTSQVLSLWQAYMTSQFSSLWQACMTSQVLSLWQAYMTSQFSSLWQACMTSQVLSLWEACVRHQVSSLWQARETLDCKTVPTKALYWTCHVEGVMQEVKGKVEYSTCNNILTSERECLLWPLPCDFFLFFRKEHAKWCSR